MMTPVITYPPQTMILDGFLNNLAAVTHFITRWAMEMGVARHQLGNVSLVSEEVFVNICVHGYRNQAGPVEIIVSVQNEYFVIVFLDRAPAFNPTQYPEPDLTLGLDERQVGGLGIHLVRRLTDRIIYQSRPGGGNQLTLLMKCCPSAPDGIAEEDQA